MKAAKDYAVVCDDYVRGPLTQAQAEQIIAWIEAPSRAGIRACNLKHEIVLVSELGYRAQNMR